MITSEIAKYKKQRKMNDYYTLEKVSKNINKSHKIDKSPQPRLTERAESATPTD